MHSLNSIRFLRALARCRRSAAAVQDPLPATDDPHHTGPTVYADAPLSRVLIAIERRASDLEVALAEYVRARRAAGVQPEAVLVEFKGILRRLVGIDAARPRLTGRLIELYFAA